MSATERAPAFQFYGRDFMADPAVQRLTWEQRGRYVWALCCSSMTDTPGVATEADWAAWMGYDDDSWTKNRDAHARCFKVTGDGWIQKRMQAVSNDRDLYAQHAKSGGLASAASMSEHERTERAKKAAATRWGKKPDDTMLTDANRMLTDANTASASVIQTSFQKETPKTKKMVLRNTSARSDFEHGPERAVVGAGDPAPPGSPPVVLIPLRDGTDFPVTLAQVQRWERTFPGVIVTDTLREMAAWAESNPTRRKTKRGALRFVTGWLLREQHKADAQGGANHGHQVRR